MELSNMLRKPRPTNMQPLLLLLLLLLLVLVLCPASTRAGSVFLPPIPDDNIVPNRIIVRLLEKPAALGGDPRLIQKQQGSFLSALNGAKLQFSLQSSFVNILNAVTLQISQKSDAYAIAELPGVETVTFARLFPGPRKPISVFDVTAVKAAAAQGFKFKPEHDMTNVTQVQKLLNVTGSGVKVGIIDTGIDYTHPAFGSCKKIGPACRVAFGKDLFDKDNNPMDCDGHGTHVAGIVGGKDDVVVGVAPNVTLGAYRIFGCAGGTTDDLIIGGMEAAVNDKMDVINLSVGGGSTWPQDPLALAADSVTNKGVLVFSAMGNSGWYGLWQGSAPGMSALGSGVASIENVAFVSSAFQVSPANATVAFSQGTSSKIALVDAPLAIPNGTVATYGCKAFVGKALQGRIALVSAGNCDTDTKVVNVQKAGATGVVIYNNAPGIADASVSSPQIRVPVVGISQMDGLMLMKLGSQNQTLHWLPLNQSVVVPNPTGRQVSGFSSWGLSPDLTIKPDIAAPGGLIFSSIPLKLGGYAVYSGTSMATPYTAGVAALYLASRSRKVGSTEMKQVLQNSAVPVTQGSPALTSVAWQGAGLLNALNAIQGSTTASPTTLPLSFLNQSLATVSRTVVITNTGPVNMTYTFSHTPASTVNATSFLIGYTNTAATASFNTTSVLLAPSRSQAVLINFNLASLGAPQLVLFSGYVNIIPAVQNFRYSPVHVPYAGLKGQATAFVVQASNSAYSLQLPALLKNNGQAYVNPNQKVTFTFKASTADVPSFQMSTLRPAYAITLPLFEVSTNKFLGYLGNVQYVGVYWPFDFKITWLPPKYKPAVKKDLNSSTWVPVPDGTYYVNITTSALPKIAKPAEVWRSPQIVIKTK